jgi:hypothetical protein
LSQKRFSLAFQNSSKSKSTPCISYTYTPAIATLQYLDIDHLTLNPPMCSCSSSPFNYGPAGHVITGDVDIVQNEDLISLIRKSPRYREPQSFNWRENFVSIMNAVEDYAKRCVKRENKELDTLSEWVQSIWGILKSRIRNIKFKVRTLYHLSF